MILQKFKSYLLFKKDKSPDGKSNFNLKMMHGINKISILMFLIGMIVLVYKIAIK